MGNKQPKINIQNYYELFNLLINWPSLLNIDPNQITRLKTILVDKGSYFCPVQYSEAKDCTQRTYFSMFVSHDHVQMLKNMSGLLVVTIPFRSLSTYFTYYNNLDVVTDRKNNLMININDDGLKIYNYIQAFLYKKDYELKFVPDYYVTIIDMEWGRNRFLLNTFNNLLSNNDIDWNQNEASAPPIF